ncbi:hypothetical protein DDE05_40490 [Streptomyces cavourensis]|nr:hypothetical protein DDE05_40490 [Streptomyces cavourensis]
MHGGIKREPSSVFFCERRVLEALHNDELRAYFQPKVELESMRVIGFEVLARWEPEPGIVIPPAKFLPIIERIGALDLMLFRLVEQATSTLRDMGGADMGLAFNVSPVQLFCPSLAQRFLEVLQGCHYDPRKITIEVTEECPIVDLEVSERTLRELKRAGCRLAMDDYGKGYSSLTRLVKLPFDEIKLDGYFAGSAAHCLPIVQNALALARSLNLSLVVEGVEHIELHDRLLTVGCTLAQGYFYGMPVGADGLPMHLSR